MEALKSIRGTQRVTDQNPEGKYQALEKYGRDLTDEARTYLAEKGYDPVYGARPLKRTIQRQVQDPLAMKILQGEFKDGDHITIDVAEGQLIFKETVRVVV